MKATQLTLRIFGGLMGLAGIEHGIGEILQGSRTPEGLFILSWPDAPFFAIMNGEPAMTIVPNLLITGILAVLFSAAYFAFAVFYPGWRKTRPVLMLLSLPMLLCGSGLFPPVLGLIIGAAAGNSPAGPRWWSKLLPRTGHARFGKAWLVLFIICVAAWLLLLPGMNILSYFLGIDNETLMLVVLVTALASLLLTFFAAFSHDAVIESGSARQMAAIRETSMIGRGGTG